MLQFRVTANCNRGTRFDKGEKIVSEPLAPQAKTFRGCFSSPQAQGIIPGGLFSPRFCAVFSTYFTTVPVILEQTTWKYSIYTHIPVWGSSWMSKKSLIRSGISQFTACLCREIWGQSEGIGMSRASLEEERQSRRIRVSQAARTEKREQA